MSIKQRFAIYASVREAYRHLETKDYPAYQLRDNGNLAVVFFHQTCVVRLFRKLETIGNWYAWSIYETNVYTDPIQLSIKFTKDQLMVFSTRISGKMHDTSGLTTLEVARLVWKLMQTYGSIVDRDRPQMDAVSSDSDKYVVNLSLLRSLAFQEQIDAMPKQCKIIASELRDLGISAYTEEELEAFARRLHVSGKLKTKQDPFRIVRYYAPELGKLGVMEYSTRKVKEVEDV